MNAGMSLLGGMGLGAGLMYFFDPNVGRRRRALVRDQAIGALNRIDDFVATTMSDISHRAQGLKAEFRARLRTEQVSDEVLIQRVRSKLGRYVSHPHAIRVTAHSGQIALSGPILANEVNDLLCAVKSVRGVIGVDPRSLTVHGEAGDVPELQGGRRRMGERLNLLEENWAPTTRLVAGALGCGLMAHCLTRRTPLAVLLGTVGFGLFVRSLRNGRFGQRRSAPRTTGRREPAHREMTADSPQVVF